MPAMSNNIASYTKTGVKLCPKPAYVMPPPMMAGTAKKIKIPNFLLIFIRMNLLVSVNVNPPAAFR